MNEILLITFANNIYRDKLALKGFRVVEYTQPLKEESISEYDLANFTGTAVIEIIEDSIQTLEKIITILRQNSVRIILITASINNKLRNFFLNLGIADVLESGNSERISEYIDITEKDGNKKYGKIIILDDNVKRKNIFETIIGRFNYSPIIMDSINQLFEFLSEINIQLILVNIGAKDFDLSFFLRKSISLEIIKKIPIIPYKDSAEGIFIHEMISGLNKIAKVILTVDEAYSFLVDILFRKELSPGINLLKETIDMDNLNRFAGDTLSKIYNSIGIDIFHMKKIITKDNLNIISGRIDSLKTLIVKVDGLKWLIKSDTISNLSIGGI